MEIRSFNLTFKRPSFRCLRLCLLVYFHMIKMDAFAQRTFLGRRIAKNLLRKFCAERLNHVIVEEIGERTLTTYSGVGFEVAGVLVHWDMYYAVEDDEGWRDIDG